MHSNMNFYKAWSVKSFSDYRKEEASNGAFGAVGQDGTLLDYETLELRVHPPNIAVDNDSYSEATSLTVECANRPGTLIEVVQCFTELGLSIKEARFSSDRGWFVDDFLVTELDGRKVQDGQKLFKIRKMLSVKSSLPDQNLKPTVLEICIADRQGSLAEIVQLLTTYGIEIHSAAAWTHKHIAALVISLHKDGKPLEINKKSQIVIDTIKERLSQYDKKDAVVKLSKSYNWVVRHERRLHTLILKEELNKISEKKLNLEKNMKIIEDKVSMHGRAKVEIESWPRLDYWRVKIKCKDRDKLLFDTVCTLADLKFDIYHGSVDIYNNTASLEFFVRHRFSDLNYLENKKSELKYCLEAAIQRRFPRGLKVHMQPSTDPKCLNELLLALTKAKYAITRAKVRDFDTDKNSNVHTFYVMDSNGMPPDYKQIELACCHISGKLIVAHKIEEEQSLNGSNSSSSSLSSLASNSAKEAVVENEENDDSQCCGKSIFLDKPWNQDWIGNPQSY